MLRAHVVEGLSVTSTAAAHGYSRAAFYVVAGSFDEAGMPSLLEGCRGRRGPFKLSEEVVGFIVGSDPSMSAVAVAEAVAARFGVVLHCRTLERGRAR